MPVWAWILVAVGAALALAAAWLVMQRERSRRLQETFGPEYQRTIAERGDKRGAESELRERQEARSQLTITPLPDRLREQYGADWERVQSSFVDNPSGAVSEADRLVGDVMRQRGYPVDDFEQQAALVSVDHPEVVANYREGHTIFLSFDRGDAGTEDLRQAMRHYKALFDDLLADGEPTQEPVAGGQIEPRKGA